MCSILLNEALWHKTMEFGQQSDWSWVPVLAWFMSSLPHPHQLWCLSNLPSEHWEHFLWHIKDKTDKLHPAGAGVARNPWGFTYTLLVIFMVYCSAHTVLSFWNILLSTLMLVLCLTCIQKVPTSILSKDTSYPDVLSFPQ